MARRELVELAAAPASPPIYADDRLKVYLSDETVTTAGPGGLVRVELIIAWDDPAIDHVIIRGKVEGGGEDGISLLPYQPGDHGLERRALLLGAPPHPGQAAVSLEIVRDRQRLFHDRLTTLDVLDRGDDPGFARAAAAALHAATPLQAARKLAWLREQTVPRLAMGIYHRLLRQILRDHARRRATAGHDLLRLRHNARLATLDELPASLRAAERTATEQVLATCPTAAAGQIARIGCVGRAVDELRRLGYLGALARVPALAGELAAAGAGIDSLAPDQRYQLLVGLTLADPSNIALQRALLDARRAVEHYPPLPVVNERFAAPN